MKYIVYLTKNNKSEINGLKKIYAGVHQTENPDIFDGYIGCGVYVNQPSTYMYPKTPFQYAVKKYGPDAFERSILYIFDTAEEAYSKEEEIVDIDFIKQSHVYNACLGGRTNWYLGKSIYQFDLKGKLLKKWEYAIEAYEFFGLPREKFNYAIHDKHPLLDSLWSTEKEINITEYSTKTWGSPEVTHLYNKDGKWLGEFMSVKECAEYIGVTDTSLSKAIQQQSLIARNYYASKTMVDEFKPKARKQYAKALIYVYKENGELVGKGIGKEIMPIINEHSWATIRDAFRYKGGWFKEYYMSMEPIEGCPPERIVGNKIKVDIYTKYGEFIETLDSVKLVKEKYNVPSSKIKNLELGDRYFENYIFKYHSKR